MAQGGARGRSRKTMPKTRSIRSTRRRTPLQHRLEDGFLNAHLVDYVLRVSFDPALKKETPRVMSGQVLDGNAQLVMLLIALLDNGISDIGTSLSLQEEGKEEKGKER